MVVADFAPSNKTRTDDPPPFGGVTTVPEWTRILGHFALAAAVNRNRWPTSQVTEDGSGGLKRAWGEDIADQPTRKFSALSLPRLATTS